MSRIEVHCGPRCLPGDLDRPEPVRGIVLFAHGSGSSRRSPRNQYVARQLSARGLATLLFDLLTDAEAHDRSNVFDIALLASRLGEVIEWQSSRTDLAGLATGLFGASTGAAAALVAAAAHAGAVRAVVSRGGRPDLAGPALAQVRAPTLLIVGGADPEVLLLNREAATHMRCLHALRVVPGATHLFEEPGTLESVATLAADWFTLHLTEPSHA